MYSDLLDRGINLADVIRGEIAPSLVLAVIAGLPAGSKTLSMMAAEAHGGDWQDWFGRTAEWFLLADLYDALALNTRATGQWKNKPPELPTYPRPGSTTRDGKKKSTVASLYDKFSGGKSGGTL